LGLVGLCSTGAELGRFWLMDTQKQKGFRLKTIQTLDKTTGMLAVKEA